jgi:glycerophosphoryl diester phosphodiesterase
VIKVIAHRGASKEFPENSLEAIAEACRQGADIVETDIRQTADRVPVLCHDRNLKRLFGSQETLSRTTSDRFKQLKILGSGTPLTLENLLTMENGPGEVILDIKEFGLERTINELVCKHRWQDRVIVSSFYSIIPRRFARINPRLETALILDRIATVPIAIRLNPLNNLFLQSLGVDRFHVFYRRSNIAGCRKLVRLGHKIAFWTIDDPDEARRAAAADPYGIMTNCPRIVRETLSESEDPGNRPAGN